MTWKQQIPGCFGAVDQCFALHPSDRQHAKKLREDLVNAGVSYRDLEDGMIGHMYRKGCPRDHVDEQMKHIEAMFRAELDA